MSASSPGRWLLIIAVVVVVATLAAAIVVMGLPSTQREEMLDQRRVRDLEAIVAAVNDHARRHGSLPADLPTLAAQPGWQLAITDPVDGAPYEYRITDERAFALCAVFSTDTALRRSDQGRSIEEKWRHGAGRQCFDRKLKAPWKDD